MEELVQQLRGYVDDQRKIVDFLRARDADDHDLLIKLDTRLTEVLEKMKEILEDHEERLRVAEMISNRAVGGWAMLTAIVSTFLAAYAAFFKKP